MKRSKQMQKSITTITKALTLCTLITQCCCFMCVKDDTSRPAVHTYSALSEEAHSATQLPNFSATATFNHDIARTLFPPLFFSLYHKYSNQNQQDDQEIAIRQHLKRPSPFEDPSSARTAERMLRRMMENRYRSDGRTVCPDNRTFNLVAGSYGRLRCSNSATKIPNIGVAWEEEPKLNPQYRLNINNNIDATEEMISMTSIDKLQELLQLQLCLCHYEGWPNEIRPSVDTFNRVLRRLAWRSGNIEFNALKQTSDAEQALQWLNIMNTTLPKQFALERKHATICLPDSISMSYVIEALASHRVQAYSERKGTSKHHKTLPTANISIAEIANEMDIELESTHILEDIPFSALQKAEELFALQEEMYELNRNYKTKRALAHSYKCLLEGFGRYAVTSGSSQDGAIKRAHELLCRLEEFSDAPSSSYASVIFALSISNRPSAASVAEEVLNRMLSKMKLDQALNANDVSKSFSGCIAAYVKNNDAPNAEKILFQMIDLYESGELGEFVPEARAFGTCIAAWSKYDPSAEKSNERGRRWVSSPRQRLYNADRAESILVELERVARNEAAKNKNKYVLHATPYNIAILARVQTLETNSPKTRRSNEGIILHAQSILDHMEFEMGVAADPYTYSILLNAWTKQSCPGNEKAADYAEELLRRRIEDVDISKIYSDDEPSAKTVDDVWPNVKHYSSVLKAHANCRSPAGARKALSLLSEMEKRFYDASVISDDDEEDTDFHVDQKDAAKPDLVCYSIVIDAFAKQKQLAEASDVAFRLLRATEEKYHAGDMSMKPNNRIYTAVILSLAHSPYTGDDAAKLNNAQRAWSLLDEMKANDVQPNSFTYNYIINCCAQEASQDENEKRISFEIAIKAFQELRKMAASSDDNDGDSCSTDVYHPDSFTYAFTLKACSNLLPPSPFRTKVATNLFKECCKNGYCNDEVMKRLRWCVDMGDFHALIGTSTRDVRIDDMPSSWSRCCTPNKRRRNNPSH